MSGKNKGKIHNQLFFKMYFSYACVLVVSALLIGIIFMNVYENSTNKNYYEQMTRQAKTITDKLKQYINNEEYVDALNYVDQWSQFDAKYDLMVISNPSAEKPMSSDMQTTTLDSIHQKQFIEIIRRAFAGKSSTENIYSDIHYERRYVVGMPIKGANDSIVGALVFTSSASGQEEIVHQSIFLIIRCIICAFLISIIVANLFVRNLTKPIFRMRDMTNELANGNYSIKTEIHRKDELGELADTIDILSERLEKNEQERKELDQMRIDFFANVSHELRTPITVVRAYTETLYDKVVTQEDKVQQYYERMLSECKSMERLVGDLLVLSKMQNPDFQIEKEPVNINQILDDIIRNASAISQEKQIRIEADRDPGNILMMGDYDRLRQMLMVIVDNAVKFSKEGSTIHIKLRKSDIITISIRDEGIGISQEELPYIFDKFYRSKLRQNAKGSGLGLAIAKQIALKHNGLIEVESEPEKGTMFTFKFQMLTQEELDLL